MLKSLFTPEKVMAALFASLLHSFPHLPYLRSPGLCHRPRRNRKKKKERTGKDGSKHRVPQNQERGKRLPTRERWTEEDIQGKQSMS